MRDILDDLSVSDEPRPWDWFLRSLSTQRVPKLATIPEQKDWLLDLLRRLELDHYVTRLESGWVFKYRLIKDWWGMTRGLRDD